MKKNILEKIGFTQDQSRIYLALLELGRASISDISRETGMYRPAIYKTLPGLVERGVVGVMPKGKNTVYVPESPERLEKMFEDLEDDFNAEIHHFRDMYAALGKKPQITFKEGDEAIKEVFSDVVHSLKKGDIYYRYSSALTLARQKYVPRDYRSVRDRKGLERYIITDESSKKMVKNKLGRYFKAVSNDEKLFDYNITQIIYGDKVAVIDYNTKTTIVIKNEMIAKFQRKIFKLLYSKL